MAFFNDVSTLSFHVAQQNVAFLELWLRHFYGYYAVLGLIFHVLGTWGYSISCLIEGNPTFWKGDSLNLTVQCLKAAKIKASNGQWRYPLCCLREPFCLLMKGVLRHCWLLNVVLWFFVLRNRLIRAHKWREILFWWENTLLSSRGCDSKGFHCIHWLLFQVFLEFVSGYKCLRNRRCPVILKLVFFRLKSHG